MRAQSHVDIYISTVLYQLFSLFNALNEVASLSYLTCMNRELFCPPSVSLRSFLDSERLVAAMLNLVYLARQAGGEVTYE